MHFSKFLPLLAIAGTLMVTPGAVQLDRDCKYLCYQHLQQGSLIYSNDRTCQDVIDDYGGSCTSYSIALSRGDWPADRPKHLDRSWTRQLPDLREYGLY